MSIYRKIIGNYLITSALLSTKRHQILNTNKVNLRSESRTMSTMSWSDFSIAYVTAPNTQVAQQIAQYLYVYLNINVIYLIHL